MLFPENPAKRPALWSAVATQLARDEMCYVISNGVDKMQARAIRASATEVETCLQRMRTADACRLSASRAGPVAPHFAVMQSITEARLTELITYPSAGESTVSINQLRRDLETVLINLFYEHPDLQEVLIPLHIAGWDFAEATMSSTDKGLSAKRAVK